jgi:hypothetical protein
MRLANQLQMKVGKEVLGPERDFSRYAFRLMNRAKLDPARYRLAASSPYGHARSQGQIRLCSSGCMTRKTLPLTGRQNLLHRGCEAHRKFDIQG